MDKMDLPSTDDYEIQIHGIEDEMKYVIRHKTTGVIEYMNRQFPRTFDELLILQTEYDVVLEMFNSADDVMVLDDGVDGGGKVH